MGLFSKKKKKQEEKPVEQEKKPKYYPNHLIGLKPVVVLEEAINVIKQTMDTKEFKKQMESFGSKKSMTAFLQGYNYALLILSTSKDIEKFNTAYVTFRDLPKATQDWLNGEDSK